MKDKSGQNILPKDFMTNFIRNKALQLVKEEMLDLIRKDRPTQTIYEVLEVKDHPLKNTIDGLLYEVIVKMEIEMEGCKAKEETRVLPYPHKPYQLWLKEMFRKATQLPEN